MSQEGKVLHLYVEVRSVSEEEHQGLGGSDDGAAHRMLHCSDAIPESHSPDRRQAPPPGSSSPSKSSSRHSVSFQLQSPDATGSPTQFHRQDLSHEGLSQLLRVLGPRATVPGQSGSHLARTRPSEVDPCRGKTLTSPSSMSSVPSTPSGHRRSFGDTGVTSEEGRTSLVTFGYIEKANVRGGGGDQRQPGNPLHWMEEGRRLPKRSSDPVWYGAMPGQGDPYRPDLWRSRSPRGSPCLQRASPDPPARDATCRALEEFGSPELRRRFVDPRNYSPTLPRHYQHSPPRCRSWGASPVLPRSAFTLPAKAQLDRRDPAVQLPRSPASDRLCSQTGCHSNSLPWTSSLCSRGSWGGGHSPSMSRKLHPALPAGRPTNIQHEVPTGRFCSSNYSSLASDCPSTPDTSHDATQSMSCSSCGAVCSRPPRSDAVSPTYGRSCISPTRSPEVACKLAAKLSSTYGERRTPSPASSQAGSPRSETRNVSFLRDSDDPALRWKTPRSGPGRASPPLTWKGPSSAAVLPTSSSPEQLHRLWPRPEEPPEPSSRRGADGRPVQDGEGFGRLTPGGCAPRKEERHPEVGRGDGEREELQDHSDPAGSASRSSSGVTGSTAARNGNRSLETSIQSNHNTADRGSGKQPHDCSSSRSQKIAKAKWDFLFGGREAPSASSSPNPTPPSSLHLKPANQRRGWGSEDPGPSHRQVRRIVVEPVTPDSQGSTPRTGIIRHTLQYSETDLDAVPLRCYRETDLDEVMRAEAEAADEEVDSAFWSNRSILENSSCSPADASPKPRTGGDKEDGKEEEEQPKEEEQEEGVVSWATVRMLGDQQRQRTTNEEDDVFSLLLKGSLAPSDSRDGLKSPISIGGPRRPSESNLDSFSRHFESIMESHRAKGTSYSSLDSVDLLTSGSTSVFTFDLPTLTPEIQSQICESAKQIIELSFAPLAQPDPHAPPAETSCSNGAPAASGEGLRGGTKDNEPGPPVRSRSEKESGRRHVLRDGIRKASSTPSLHGSPRERPGNRPPEPPYPQADVVEQLPLGGDDVLLNGSKADLQAARRLAKRLYGLDGFRKSDVARHLGKNNEFSQMVAEEYLSNFSFRGLTIDQALRTFLNQFALMGETQERERVLAQFSRRYRQCNPQSVPSEDSVHTLTCAVMLLNSDLHGNNVGKRMSCSQFITNLEGLNDGRDFPKDLLKTLYSSIKNEKLQWTIDEEELRKSTSELADVRTDSASHTMKRLGGGGNPLVGVAQQADGELYKSGFLIRKVHADPDGRRTARGKRGWKSFYAVLKGLVLYLQKEEFHAERELTEEDVKNAVSIHHSLALRAADYSKRPDVFYLRTADWRVFLLQAPNAEQMQSWITRINVVAAMFSAPPFPAAIGSQKRFSRPLLPGSNTKLSQEEQVKCHESRFRAVSSELADLTASMPDRKVKGRELEEQKLRQEYLEFEKTRYGTYAMLLRAKLSSGDEDLAAFESRLFDDGGLQRAHSSPTLPVDDPHREKSRGAVTSKSLKVTSSSSSKAGGGTKEGSKKKKSSRPEEG
ncbi:psd [Pungitius sinensis]